MKKKKEINLRGVYKHFNRNMGRIKSISDDIVIANINAGHGGGDVEVPISHCYEFTPMVNDRVKLCLDEDGQIPGLFLTLVQSAADA